MIKHKQLFKHNPEKGSFGDCHRTCLACLLHLHPIQVPNFGEFYYDIDDFKAAELSFLHSLNLDKVEIPFTCTLEQLLESMNNVNPHAYFILGGGSINKVNHSVIAGQGKILWDPSLDAEKDSHTIIGPMTDGYFWVTFLIPRNLTI